MTRDQFTAQLLEKFKSIISRTERDTAADIQGHRDGMDSQTFAYWLQSEQLAANNEPGLKVFYRQTKGYWGTPEAAAEHLAGIIFFTLEGAVNWADQWKQAQPLLVGLMDERAKAWKYFEPFNEYMRGLRARTRAQVLANVTKPKANPKPDILPDHLSLEDAVKDANILPRIWELCAAQERPAFDIAGNFIWESKGTDAVLYAFAAAMKSRILLKPDIKPKTFYAILCKKYDIPQASRPDKIQKGKNIYPDMLSDFLGILSEFTH